MVAFRRAAHGRTVAQHPGLGSRQERLGRGLVAIRTAEGVFLTWRLLRSEDAIFGEAEENAVFTLVRDGEPIARIADATCYLDREGTMGSSYRIEASRGPDSATVRPLPSGSNFFDIPLVRPSATAQGEYTIGDVSVGDLDGDGEYELVVKWDCNPRDNAESGRTGDVLLEAYRLDGERLWEMPINLGPNIRAGAHYTQYLVYDFDGDGKAEITCKTAPGSRDGCGDYVNRVSRTRAIRSCRNDVDFSDENGRILQGDEFFTIFCGKTGRALDTIYYPNQRIDSAVWGDDYGNRVDRFTATVAYLDGIRPYAVYMRGYYMSRNPEGGQRQAACAITFDGECLHCQDSFDTLNVALHRRDGRSSSFTRLGSYKGMGGYARGNWRYAGEGNHNCAVADVDGDGRDEVMTGALCYHLDALGRFRVKWCTFLEHGDAMHLGAYDPGHPGFELFTVHEESGENKLTGTKLDCGMSVLDAATGAVRFHVGSPSDTGRGMMANVGAGGYYQFWGAAGAFCQPEGDAVPHRALGGGVYERIELGRVSTNFRIFWDGDLFDELLDGNDEGGLTVTSWDGTAMRPIFSTQGCTSINGTKQVPCLQADILGDWREEILVARNDNSAIRVYTSDVPTRYKLMTLMHDPVYRMGVAAQQSGYNQPPHIGFYLGESCFSDARSADAE